MLSPATLKKLIKQHGKQSAIRGKWEVSWSDFGHFALPNNSTKLQFISGVGNYPQILAKIVVAWSNYQTVALYDSTSNALEYYNQIAPESAQFGFTTPTDPALVLFTSGSTGRPKAVVLSGENLYYSALGSWEYFQWAPSDLVALSLPLYHIGGIMIFLRALLAGQGMYWRPEHYLQWCGREQVPVQYYSFVPTQLAQLIRLNRKNLCQAKRIIVSGAPCSLTLQQKIATWQLPVSFSYGATESTAQITVDGKLLPYRQLAIGPNGKIRFRGLCRFLSYCQDGAMLRPFDPEGWWESNDFGQWHTDGRLEVGSRSDLVYISGGKKISPIEIEEMLDQVTSVVVPVDDEKWGQVGFCFYSGPADPQELKAFLALHLPHWKIPHYFYPDPALDSAVGKISRQQKQAQAQALIDKQIDNDE